MKPLTLAGSKRVIAAMQISLEEGTIDVLHLMLAELGPKIEALGDPHQFAALMRIRFAYKASRDLERKYGAGCLLDLSTPNVREKINRGWLPLNLVKNAEAYCAELNSRSRTCNGSTHH